MSESRQNLFIGLSVIIGGSLLFWNTFYFSAPIKPEAPGPAFFPRIILVILFILGISLLAGLLVQERKKEVVSEGLLIHYGKIFIAAGMMISYLVLLPYLGFLLASFLYISLSLMNRMADRIRVLALAAASSAFLYFIFTELLNVRLPHLYLF